MWRCSLYSASVRFGWQACRRDVRVIFAKSLRVLDTTDRDRALEELDREREARRRLELDFAVVQVGTA